MASNSTKFVETLNSHCMYQCMKEELCHIAEKFEIPLVSKLKEDTQKELIEALMGKSVLLVEDEK